MRISLSSLLVLLPLLLAPSAHAQLADSAAAAGPRAWAPMTTQPAAAVQPERRRSDEVLALGGLVGGGAGLVVGAVAGTLLERPAYQDCLGICIGWGTVIGGLAGEALGLALGVHVANGRRGSLPLGMLTSAGILTVGAIGGNNIPPMLLIVPVTQIIATVTVERRTERRR